MSKIGNTQSTLWMILPAWLRRAAVPALPVTETETRAAPAFNTKIRNLCLVLSMLVVFNHSNTYAPLIGADQHPVVSLVGPDAGASPLEVAVQFFLSGSMWRVTNPVFFMASGFFFFFGWRPTLLGLHRKLSKRVFTLLGPFLIWTVLTMALNFVAHALASYPAYRAAWEADGLTFSQLVTFFLNMPSSSQLWFLRDLIYIMAFAVPVLALVLPRLRGFTILLFLVVYFSNLPNPGVDRTGLCFFGIGATLGYLRLQPSYSNALWRRLAVMAWIGTAAAYTILALFSDWNLTPLFNLLILVGIFGMWGFYDLLPAGVHTWLTRLSPYRFFIYMTFDPLLPILQRIAAQWLTPNPLTNLLSYFLMPLVVIALCVGIASCLRQRLPTGYSFLTGGR